jgi:hypothetical protein
VPFDILIGTFKMSHLTKNNLVAQTNRLIEARYTMTKNELLLLFAMVSLINPKDKDFLTFKTSVAHLSEILGIHPATAPKIKRRSKGSDSIDNIVN